MSSMAWVTIAGYNPIISDIVGPSITMSSSSNANSGKFTLKKEVMVENKDATVVKDAPLTGTGIALLKGNQPVDIEINTCYLARTETSFPTTCFIDYCPTTT